MRATPRGASGRAARDRAELSARKWPGPAEACRAIRPARLSELTAVWQLAVACFSDDALSSAVLGLYLTGRNSTVLVVRNGSGLAGFTVLRVARDQGQPIGLIVSLGVDEACRRNGIGRRLLRAARRWCQQAGAVRMRLDVARDNAGALALYRDQGYRVVGTQPHYYGVGRDGLRMERPTPYPGVRRQSR